MQFVNAINLMGNLIPNLFDPRLYKGWQSALIFGRSPAIHARTDMIFSVGIGSNIGKSPCFDATVADGVRSFSVLNHMYIPGHFGDPDGEYERLYGTDGKTPGYLWI